MFDILPTEAYLIVLGRGAFRVFERSRSENGAIREGAAFMLTIGAMADRGGDRLTLAFEFNCSAHTRTFVDHFDWI